MSFSLIAIMVGGLLLTGGVVAIVLFIVGLAKRRPAMWATGLVLGMMVLLMVVGVGGMALFVAAPMTMTASPGSTPTPPTLLTTSPTGRAVSTFEECTGLALPDGAGVRRAVTRSSSGSSGDTKECLLSLTVPGGFGAFLEANFKKATWQEVSPALTGPQVRSHRTWAIRDIEGAAYYTLTHSGGDGAAGIAGAAGAEATETWTTSVAYNAKTGQAYVVGVRTKAGK